MFSNNKRGNGTRGWLVNAFSSRGQAHSASKAAKGQKTEKCEVATTSNGSNQQHVGPLMALTPVQLKAHDALMENNNNNSNSPHTTDGSASTYSESLTESALDFQLSSRVPVHVDNSQHSYTLQPSRSTSNLSQSTFVDSTYSEKSTSSLNERAPMSLHCNDEESRSTLVAGDSADSSGQATFTHKVYNRRRSNAWGWVENTIKARDHVGSSGLSDASNSATPTTGSNKIVSKNASGKSGKSLVVSGAGTPAAAKTTRSSPALANGRRRSFFSITSSSDSKKNLPQLQPIMFIPVQTPPQALARVAVKLPHTPLSVEHSPLNTHVSQHQNEEEEEKPLHLIAQQLKRQSIAGPPSPSSNNDKVLNSRVSDSKIQQQQQYLPQLGAPRFQQQFDHELHKRHSSADLNSLNSNQHLYQNYQQAFSGYQPQVFIPAPYLADNAAKSDRRKRLSTTSATKLYYHSPITYFPMDQSHAYIPFLPQPVVAAPPPSTLPAVVLPTPHVVYQQQPVGYAHPGMLELQQPAQSQEINSDHKSSGRGGPFIRFSKKEYEVSATLKMARKVKEELKDKAVLEAELRRRGKA